VRGDFPPEFRHWMDSLYQQNVAGQNDWVCSYRIWRPFTAGRTIRDYKGCPVWYFVEHATFLYHLGAVQFRDLNILYSHQRNGACPSWDWSYIYFAFFSLHSYIYRVINLLISLSWMSILQKIIMKRKKIKPNKYQLKSDLIGSIWLAEDDLRSS